MGALEDLALSIYGADTQKAIEAENPYLKISKALSDPLQSALVGLASKSPTAFDWKDYLGPALASGAVSGIGELFGKPYQNKLTDRLFAASMGQETDVPLTPALENIAGRNAKAINVLGALQDREDERVINRQVQADERTAATQMKRDLVKSAIENPWAMKEAAPLLERILGGDTKLPTKSSETPTVKEQPTEKPSGKGVESTLVDEVSAEAQKLMRQGAKPEQAWTTARSIFSEKKERLGRQYKSVEDAQKSADEIRALAGDMEIALGGAGNTGALGGLKQSVAGLMGASGFEGQRKKYSAGQDVENLANKAVQAFGRAFKGPMSDKDVQIMLRAAPQLSTEEEANQQILNRWHATANIQQAYADFMRDAQDRGIEPGKAESSWQLLKKENPYVIRDQKGNYEINPFWLEVARQGVGGIEAPSVSNNSKAPNIGELFNGKKVTAVRKIK